MKVSRALNLRIRCVSPGMHILIPENASEFSGSCEPGHVTARGNGGWEKRSTSLPRHPKYVRHPLVSGTKTWILNSRSGRRMRGRWV